MTEDDIIAISPDGSGQRAVEEHRRAQQPAAHRTMRQLLPDVLPATQERDDGWLFESRQAHISLLPSSAQNLGLTGGEPTLHADELIGLLEHCRGHAPRRRCTCCPTAGVSPISSFARRYAQVGLGDIMAGIPSTRPTWAARLHRPSQGRFRRDDPRNPEPRLTRTARRDPDSGPAATPSRSCVNWPCS